MQPVAGAHGASAVIVPSHQCAEGSQLAGLSGGRNLSNANSALDGSMNLGLLAAYKRGETHLVSAQEVATCNLLIPFTGA